MQISVIIPTLNEAENMTSLLTHLSNNLNEVSHELIVSDGASSDNTRIIAEKHNAIVLNCEKRNRAFQMNEGARIAKGELLYFVHADSLPPKGFYDHIMKAISEGYDLGCFRFKFDSDRWILAVNSYFTRFDRMVCRGGDQTLFIKKNAFDQLSGYLNDYKLMEEYEFINRARKSLKFKIIPHNVKVSARKYEENSYIRVNIANFIVFTMFRFGASQEKMVNMYYKLLKHPKAEAQQ